MYQLGAMQGWQCPLCKRIYGPFVRECFNCNNIKIEVKTTDVDGLKIDWNKTTEMSAIPQIY